MSLCVCFLIYKYDLCGLNNVISPPQHTHIQVCWEQEKSSTLGEKVPIGYGIPKGQPWKQHNIFKMEWYFYCVILLYNIQQKRHSRTFCSPTITVTFLTQSCLETFKSKRYALETCKISHPSN